MSLMSPRFVLLVLLISCVCNSPAQAEWFKEDQGIMGTAITVELWDDNPQHAQDCIDKVMAEMHRINELMSPFREDTALAEINRDATRRPVKVPVELFDLIKRSLHFSRLSDGAFDISFASAGHLYNYREKQKPTAEQLQQATIDYRQIQMNDSEHSIRLGKPGMRLDLGGIAKGYAVDNSIRLLQQCSIRHARVTAGGDSRLLGDRRGRPWIIGIRHPRQQSGSVMALPLNNIAVSTSGDYERYFEQEGERYHHILSPRSGESVKGVWSVTVIGPEATTTDALSTTVFVLGVKAGLALIEKFKEYDTVIIDAQARLHYSSGLAPPGQ